MCNLKPDKNGTKELLIQIFTIQKRAVQNRTRTLSIHMFTTQKKAAKN